MSDFETRYNRVRKNIARLYMQPAQRIAQLVESSSLVVLTGPFENGKSDSLLPLLVANLDKRGLPAVVRNVQETQYSRPSYAEGLTRDLDKKTSVLILDEAGRIGQAGEGKEDVAKLLQAAQAVNHRVVSVIAYYASNIKHRDRQTQVWVDAAKEVSGKSGSVVNLPPFRLSSNLARELLETCLSQFGRDVPAEYVNYVLDNVPANPGVLHLMARVLSSSSHEPRRRFLSYLEGHVDGMMGTISVREAKKLKDTIEQDLGFKQK